MKLRHVITLSGLIFALSSCATWRKLNETEKGGALGAGAGILIGAGVGGPAGALVGGAAGAFGGTVVAGAQ